MELGLTGKVAWVTGASKGIGLAVAEALAAEGMAVALAARSGAALADLAGRIEGGGGRALAFPADLRDPAAPAAFAEAALARFGRVDLLVNNAGATRRGDFLALTDDDWRDGFALKFDAAVRLTRAAWPHLARTGGSVVNIAGVGGRTASADFTIGGSVNAALLNFTKALADRGVRDGVRVNALNPGSVVTDRLAGRIEQFAREHAVPTDEARRRMTAAMGVARFGTPGEIAAAVAFLAGNGAAYIQGALLDIDGGLTRTL